MVLVFSWPVRPPEIYLDIKLYYVKILSVKVNPVETRSA
jgi:hypothetical protein